MNTPKLILAECRNWFEDVHAFDKNYTVICIVKMVYQRVLFKNSASIQKEVVTAWLHHPHQ